MSEYLFQKNKSNQCFSKMEIPDLHRESFNFYQIYHQGQVLDEL